MIIIDKKPVKYEQTKKSQLEEVEDNKHFFLFYSLN